MSSSTTVASSAATSTVATTVATTGTTTGTTTSPFEVDPIEWRAAGVGLETGRLSVPLDHEDPGGTTITIALVRRPASDPDRRIGSLLVNPGGPGYGGNVLAEQAGSIYGDALLDRFDIVGFDPRGTGDSTPSIDCIDDLDAVFGVETGPDDAAEESVLLAAAIEFAEGCAERSADLLDHISTVDAARDMDLIRRALGEDTISYFGWSYGTQLGATWATLFPATVRAAVLDGAVNPTVDRVGTLIAQAAGFDSTLTTFLADCSARPACAFHRDGDAEGAFVDLLSQLETNVVATATGRPPLNQGMFELAVAQALYSEASWPALADALERASDGDATGLLSLYDAYYGRRADGTYGDEIEAYFAITCGDDPATGDSDDAVAARRGFLAASPRIGTSAAYEVLICAALAQVQREAPAVTNATGGGRFEITGDGAGPIVVVGNTGDPATPFAGSRLMARTLEDGVFVAVEADSHTAYGLNRCIDDTIEAYLVDLTVPDEGTAC